MGKVNLSRYDPPDNIRFLDRKTGKMVAVDDIVSVVDTDTGHYTGYQVEDEVPLFDDEGNPVVVRGSFNRAIDIHVIGAER